MVVITLADTSDCLLCNAEVKCSMTDDGVTGVDPVADAVVTSSSTYRRNWWAMCSAELIPASVRDVIGCNTDATVL